MPVERKASVQHRNRLAFPKKRDQSKGQDHALDTSAEDNFNLFPRVTCRSHRVPSEESRDMTGYTGVHTHAEWERERREDRQ